MDAECVLEQLGAIGASSHNTVLESSRVPPRQKAMMTVLTNASRKVAERVSIDVSHDAGLTSPVIHGILQDARGVDPNMLDSKLFP